MPSELVLPVPSGHSRWQTACVRLAITWAALFALTFPEWRTMAHQWWNIDTYSHILLILPICGWLTWLRRAELAKIAPQGWLPGLALVVAGLTLWLAGREAGINTVAQGGAVLALEAALIALLSLRAALLLAFPLAYALLLVPVGGEIIPPLQLITAKLAAALTGWSGVPMIAHGIHIDTPAGRFNIAEECAGVKFLIAMFALGVLVAWTCFSSWKRRAVLLLACIIVPIVANIIRAWATIYIAQHVGAEAAGSFDHIVYGWIFFGIVIALVLGFAWRWFERDPEDAGWSAGEVDALPVMGLERFGVSHNGALVAILLATAGFAVLALLV